MSDKIEVTDNDAGIIGNTINAATGISRSSYTATITTESGETKTGEGGTKEEAIKNAYDS